MTKEDIKQICQIYDNFRSERDAATIAYNSDDTFWEHILATYNLSQSSLPSNLDEAAEKYSENILANNEDLQDAIEDAFKAGAGWMAGQGETIEVEVKEDAGGYPYIPSIELYDYDKDEPLSKPGDEVVVQIRKK